MRCRVCDKGYGEVGERCSYCGAELHSRLGGGMPLPIPQKDYEAKQKEIQEKKDVKLKRRREFLCRHAINGAILLTAFLFVVFIVAQFLTGFSSLGVGLLGLFVVGPIVGGSVGFMVAWLHWPQIIEVGISAAIFAFTSGLYAIIQMRSIGFAGLLLSAFVVCAGYFLGVVAAKQKEWDYD